MNDILNQPSYRGDKLRLIRVAQGYSLDELGKEVGVTRQNIHKMEAGQEPKPEQLSKLCEFLNVGENYFYGERNTPVVEEQCHFRSLRSRTKTLTNTVMARAELLDTLIKEIEKYFDLPEFDLPDVCDLDVTKVNDVEQAAKRLRDFWNLGEGPIADITTVLENSGAVIATVNGVDEKVDAFSMSRKRPVIIRNSAKSSPCRYRFDLAHELAHLLMHEGIVTGCKETEKQANAFASAFLMPESTFRNAIRKYPITRGVKTLNWTSLNTLKLYFKVSFKALLYRAKQLGLISDDQMRSGYIYLNKNGYTKIEPLDDQIELETPDILQSIINALDSTRWQKTIMKLGLTQTFVQRLLPDLQLPKIKITLV